MVGTVAVGFTVTSLTTAYADVLSQKRSQAQQLQSQVTRLQQQIEKDQQQESSYKKQLDSLTASLNTVHASLVDNQKQYSAVLSQVNQLQTKIQQNQQNLNKSEDELAAQLRYMYESGGQGYLDVLFGAQSFSDFLSRLSEMAMVGNNSIRSFKRCSHCSNS
ncbi:hypothetical protein GCM10025857_09360 [Alicyclobacillus contaminans]|nr:hypothetical protein GCM10025857_09360 [Alicyclobacillus contaminans]